MTDLTPNQQKQQSIIIGFFETKELLWFLYDEGRDARKGIALRPAKTRRKSRNNLRRVLSKIPRKESLEQQIKAFQQAEIEMKEKGEWTPSLYTTLPPSSEKGSLLSLRKVLNQK